MITFAVADTTFHPPHDEPSESSITGRRRLSAIMFTDIKGFTSLMERDEDTAVGLIKAHREIVRRHIAIHSGEERETIGDAFLVLFESALQAVQCAVAIQQELSQFNKGREPRKQIWMRAGIHVGDIIIEEGSVFGEGVNLAARIETLARPGGICITQQVLDHIKTRIHLNVERLGVRELKNVTDAPAIYRVLFDADLPPFIEAWQEKFYRISHKRSVMIGIPLVIATLASAFIYSSFFKTHVSFAHTVGTTYHIPYVIGKVSVQDTERLQTFSEIYRKGRKVSRVTFIDRQGMIPEEAEQPWRFQLKKSERRNFYAQEFTYYKDGDVAEIRFFDRFGTLQHKLTFKEGGRVATVHDASGYIKTFENQISSFGFSFDESGRVIQKENRNAFGALRNDNDGIAVYRLSYDDHGALKEVSHFDAFGNLVENKDGVAIRQFIHNALGLPEKEITLDRYKVVKESLSGYAIVERTFDDFGNVTEEKFFDRNGSLVETNDGICQRRITYNDHGQPTEESFLSCSGQPTANRSGWSITRSLYDDKGQLISRSYFDKDQTPTADTNGIHRLSIVHDDRGRITQVSSYNTENLPTLNADDVYAVVYRYNEQGQPISRTYLGKNSEPQMGKAGYAEIRVSYSDRGEVAELAYFDNSGNLVNNHEGYAVVRNEYDSFGNLISRTVFNKENQPALARQPVCYKIALQYDKKGNLAETRCFDPNLELTAGMKNCAITKYTYNEYEKLARHECYVAEGQFIDQPNIPSALDMKYDKRGYLSEVRAYNASGELAERYQGAAIWKRKSDAYGNQIEIATYDRNGKLITNPRYRAAIFRREFDNRGNELRLTAFDENEKPVAGIWGFAEIRYAYDDRGHKISEANFDETGHPTTDRNGVHEYRWSYDEKGRIVERRFYQAEGKLVANNVGVALIRNEYNEWGWLSKVRFYGTDEQPAPHQQSQAALQEFIRNDQGQITNIRNFNVTENLCQSPCIPIIEQEYDGKGRLIHRFFRSAAGNRIHDEEGIGAYRFLHDIQGRVVTESLFTLDNQPMLDRWGVHSYRMTYIPDADDLVWHRKYENAQGKPVTALDGSSLQIILYDETYREKLKARVSVTAEGNITRIECFDDAENVSDRKDCASTAEVLAEFKRIAAHR